MRKGIIHFFKLERVHLLILISIFVIQAMAVSGTQGLLSLIPYFKEQWGLKEVEVGFLTSLMYTGVVFCSINAGQLTDYFGERRMICWGLTFIGLTLLFLSHAYNYTIALILMFFSRCGVQYNKSIY